MITIGEPKIKRIGKKTRLFCEIEINETIKTLWLDVDKKYGGYLVKDRSDAFLIAMLPIAMRNGKDIVCLSPVSEELLHNIRTILIPTLTRTGKNFYKTRISAEVRKKPVKNAGAVGTGMSRGIDSFHVLNEYIECDYPTMRLTHLMINDVGGFDIPGYKEGGRDNLKIKEECIKESIEVAEKQDLPYILTNSNLAADFDIKYGFDHMYFNLFPVFAMQKLFKIWYYGSSGRDYSMFSLDESDRHECGNYELLLDNVFSTSGFKVLSEGGEKTFLEKVADILHYAPAHKHLHVCITDSKNCSKCVKCMRTMLALDSLDRLDYFSQVFDINYYYKNKNRFLAYLEKCNTNNNKIMQPIYEQFAKRKLFVNSEPDVLKENIVLPEKINTSALIIKDLNSGEIIMKKRIRDEFNAVGCAKILTAILALESGKTQMQTEIPAGIAENITSMTLYELINILIITQNNAAANVIAEAVSGSVEDFVTLMNKKAGQIGMENTTFTSPTGFEESNIITAEDTCKLMEYALKNQHFCSIFKTKSYNIHNGENQVKISTLNPLLREKSKIYLKDSLGVKYGIRGNMSNVVTVIQNEGKFYLAILLGIQEGKNTQNRFIDTYNLIQSVLSAK